MPSITPTFKAALVERRTKQAHFICNKLRNEFIGKRILDYGCGQGAFVQSLANRGLNGRGCDLPLTNCECQIPQDRFVQISRPWEIPPLENVDCVTLLDVLEHCREPKNFLETLHQHDVSSILIKVPMLHGPIGMLSLILSRTGRCGLLEKLLLAEDISPHHFFFTTKGLLNLITSSGFRPKEILRFPDVGSELPRRFRTPNGAPIRAVPALLMTAFGLGLEIAAPIWSDTAAVYATV